MLNVNEQSSTMNISKIQPWSVERTGGCAICGGTFRRQSCTIIDKNNKEGVTYLLICNQCGDTAGSPEQYLALKIKNNK